LRGTFPTSEEQARALLADLLDWHRREDKPAWWRYFYLDGHLVGGPGAPRPGLPLRPAPADVATSRARALAIIVASPDLIRVSCRTPHQMILANALCRAWETGS